MPILIRMPPPPTEEVRSLYEITESPCASGQDGQELLRQYESVYRQWHERTTVQLLQDGDTLQHVPFETAGSIKVRFGKATPMAPRIIEIEDPDSE